MRKKFLAVALILALAVTLCPTVLAAGKLSTPTDLQWNVDRYGAPGSMDSMPCLGAMSWNSGENSRGVFQLTIYKDGRMLSWRTIDVGSRSNFYFTERLNWLQAEEDIVLDSGTYYFTVQSLTSYNSTSSDNSDVATSPKWTYTKPSAKLDAPTAPTWDFPYCTWQSNTDDTKAKRALVQLYYSRTENGSYRHTSESPGYNTERELVNTWSLKEFGRGYYKFRVTNLSNDITQWQNSDHSAFSEPYYYDGSEIKICYHDSWVLQNEKQATCTENGYRGDYYCGDCGELLQKGEVIPALGHNLSYDGMCRRCGEQIEFHGKMGKSSELSWTYSRETNDITLEGTIGAGKTVYIACYKAGRFMGVREMDNARLSATLPSDLDEVRLIWLDSIQMPQCNAGDITLNP